MFFFILLATNTRHMRSEPVKGSCTLAKFVGENIDNSDRQQTDYVLALATLGGLTKKLK
jgi:hypothetical protein